MQRLRKPVFVASIHGMCHIAAIGVALSKAKSSVPLHNELGLFFALLLPVNRHATARPEPIVEKGLKERLDLLICHASEHAQSAITFAWYYAGCPRRNDHSFTYTPQLPSVRHWS